MRFFICIFMIFGAFQALAQSATDYVVKTDLAPIYSAPDLAKTTHSILRKGKVVKTFGQEGDFLKIHLKGGQVAYLKASDVEIKEAQLEGDEPQPAASDDFKRWKIQIGASSGSSNGHSYSELNLGIGYSIFRWLEFENALFASFNRTENFYGLDSSLRAVLDTDIGSVGHLHLFAGPGYRFASKSDYDILFTEAGLVTSLAGFSIGGGIKTFYYSTRYSNVPDENQYFIILSGGAIF